MIAALIVLAWLGVIALVLCLFPGSTDHVRDAARTSAAVPNCCNYGRNFNCNQGDDCPLRTRGDA